jgi:hypothetical protein
MDMLSVIALYRLVRRLSAWAWRDELRLHENVAEDAQALVDALIRGERADAFCGCGRDGQASNYRDELKFSLRALPNRSATEQSHPAPG